VLQTGKRSQVATLGLHRTKIKHKCESVNMFTNYFTKSLSEVYLLGTYRLQDLLKIGVSIGP